MTCSLTVLAAVLLFTSCRDGRTAMPTSGGRPYELLVVGADSEAVAIVAAGLRAINQESLPQREPMFDVSAIVADGLTQATRYARNIVLVSTGVDSISKPYVGYAQNVFAHPQLVVHVKVNNVESLHAYIYYISAVAQQIQLQELNNGIVSLRENHHVQVEELVLKMFGARLWVPMNLTKWKKGKDFLWLSDGAVEGMQNICVYRYQGRDSTVSAMVDRRDSVMRLNMPGETANSYMVTVGPSVKIHPVQLGQMEMCGLWEMRGDAMGGPFVCMMQTQGDSTLVAEAFVYAPQMRKRHLLHRLVAALYTMKIEQ